MMMPCLAPSVHHTDKLLPFFVCSINNEECDCDVKDGNIGKRIRILFEAILAPQDNNLSGWWSDGIFRNK